MEKKEKMDKSDKIIAILVIAILIVGAVIIGVATAKNKKTSEIQTTKAVAYNDKKYENSSKEVEGEDKTKSIIINKEQFEEKLKNGEKMLVDFYATWCPPCNAMKPEIAKAIEENVTIYKIDIDEHRDLATKYGIRALPTVVSFKDGKEQDRVMGFNDAEGIKKQFEEIK